MVNPADSRDRLLAAAAKEFAARGYDGASVDRIARAARLNKAMIYYHFDSKAGLYHAIVREVFQAVHAAVTAVADGPLPPEDKMRAFIRTVADLAHIRPHFPSLWLREFSAGARHIDDRSLRVASGVVATLARIIAEGVNAGRFRSASPVMVHVGIVAPILLFLVSGSGRQRLARAGAEDAATLTLDQVVEHVTDSTLGSLCRKTGEGDA